MSFYGLKCLCSIVLLVAITAWAPGCQPGKMDNSRDEPASSNSSGQSPRASSKREFVILLKSAVESRDRKRMIALTRFPVQAEQAMMDEAAFIEKFDKIWNPLTTKAVLDEDPDHFASSNNFAFGCGEVWFQKTEDQQFRITAFDIPIFSNAGMSIADCYRARDFFTRLQGVIASDNRKEVAAMLRYPLYFHGQAKTITLHNEQDTLNHYDLIFSARFRRAVANQKAWDLFSQSDGVAIEGGFIWFNEPTENGPFRVTSIFEPPLHY